MAHQLANMDVEMVLGNPKIACDGLGICKIIQKGTVLSDCETTRLVKATIAINGDKMSIAFYTKSTNLAALSKHFANNVFSIETAIAIPWWVRKALHIATSKLKKGDYQVLKTSDFFTIEVSIQKRIIEVPPQYFGSRNENQFQ